MQKSPKEVESIQLNQKTKFEMTFYHVNMSLTMVGSTLLSHVNVCKEQNQMLLLILDIAFLYNNKTEHDIMNLFFPKCFLLKCTAL